MELQQGPIFGRWWHWIFLAGIIHYAVGLSLLRQEGEGAHAIIQGMDGFQGFTFFVYQETAEIHALSELINHLEAYYRILAGEIPSSFGPKTDCNFGR